MAIRSICGSDTPVAHLYRFITFPPGAYFLTDEKVGKESPGNFRRFPGPFGRLKGETNTILLYSNVTFVSPLRIPLKGCA